MAHLKVGTRSSALAIAQTRQVTDLLEQAGHTVELVSMETKGDQILDRALHQVGGKGLFTEELERALLSNEVDLAVHSLKDLPTVLPPGLAIGAYALPEDRRDVLIAQSPLSELAPGASLGTSSLRRTAFLRGQRPDLRVLPVRGNLHTRVAKWREGRIDGLVLAAAGVIRLGWQSLISEYLDPDVMVPSPGQGILAVEVATHRTDLSSLLSALNDARTQILAVAERAVLDELGGGCQVPLGAFAQWIGEDRLRLVAQVASVDGETVLRRSIECSASNAAGAGRQVGASLLHDGALQMIQTQEG